MLNHMNKKLHRVEAPIDEIDLKELFFYFKNHMLFISIVTTITLLLGLIYTFTLPFKYESSALIQIESQNLGGGSQQVLGSLGSLLGASAPASAVEIETALINSSFILGPVIEKLGLDVSVAPHYFPLIGSFFAHHHSKEELSKPIFGLSKYAWGGEQLTVKQFDVPDEYESEKFQLRVDNEKHYSLFMPGNHLILKGVVGVRAETKYENMPQFSILISELKANPGTYFDLTHTPINDIIDGLSQKIIITDLGAKDRAKTGVLKISLQGSNPLILPQILNTIINYTIKKDLEKKSTDVSKMLEVLINQVPAVRKNLEDAETTLNTYRSVSGSIDMSQEGKILLNELLNVEREIDELKLKKVEMLQELTPEHPSVIILVQKQQQLQQEVVDLKSRIKALPLADQKAVDMMREVKVKNELYLQLLNKVQQLEVLRASTLSDLRVLVQATVPHNPLPLHRAFIMLSSVLIGFFISIMVLFLRKISQKQIQNVEQVEDQLGISTLGVIPFSKNQTRVSQLSKIELNDKQRTSILAKNHPKDMSIEALRSLRTALQFAMIGAKNNIVTLMGASSEIGKSFISVNLAQVLSDGGKRVILVDSDMRKGKIGKNLSLKSSPGLSEVLSNKATLEDVICRVVKGFDYLPCGQYPENPSELLMTKELQVMLDVLSSRYELVIINTPPVLAVTDGIILAQHSATNIFIVDIVSNQIQDIALAIKHIKKRGIEVGGLIFNTRTEMKHAQKHHNHYDVYMESTQHA